MSFREITLGDAIHIKHGFAFKSGYFSDVGTHIVLTPGNFNEAGGFRLRPGKDRFYTGDIPDNFILNENDLIVAMTEQGPGLLGSSAIITEDGRFLHNQRLGLVDELDELLLDKWFLYYLFNTRSVRGQISGSASGTKVRHTAPERIYRVKVRVPDISVQRKIAFTLSAYDDLIENNRRRMALLEEAARLLYQEWFVRLRFPSHEHTKIINGIPEGWKSATIDDLAFLTMGQSPKSEYYNEEGNGLPFHQGVSDFGDRFVNHKRYCTLLKRIAEAGDILCSVRAPVGRLNITLDKVVIGRGLSAMKSKTGNQSFLYYQLKNHFFKEDLIGTGAIFASVKKDDLKFQKFLTPHQRLVSSYEEISKPIDKQIENLFIQNNKLKQARDLLLPKLMNGEVVT